METQKMTASAVKEITCKQAGAAAGETKLTPEQEFARILGALFSGQPVAQADAFEALRQAPQLDVADPAPVKEKHESREVEEHDAKESTEECEHSLGDEEAAPEAKQAEDDDAVEVDEVRVDVVKVDAAASMVESAASSAPSSLPIEQTAVVQAAAVQTGAAAAAAIVEQAAPTVLGETAAQAQAPAQGFARATVETAKPANAQAAQSQTTAAQNTHEAAVQEVRGGRSGQEEADFSRGRTSDKAEVKPAEAKAVASTSDFRIGLEPNGDLSGKGGVIPGSEQAALASAGRAHAAALSATQGRVPGQPATIPQSGIEMVAAKTPVQASGNAAPAFGLSAAEEGSKKSSAAGAKETLKASAKTQAQIIEQIQKVLETASKSRDGNTMIVRLDPPELGSLTVKITQRADQLFARIIPETAEVEQTLRDRATEMTQVLAANGFRTENIQVSIGMERSESESFYFNLPERGSQRRQESDGSARRETFEQLPPVDGPPIESHPRMLEAGWVA